MKMWTPGPTELVLIIFIILVLFGVGKIPEVGSGIGKGLRNFKRAIKGEDEIDVTPEGEQKKALEDKKEMTELTKEEAKEEEKQA
jgi:sec-independent protein translocase protein TatA